MPELIPDFHEVLARTEGPAETLDTFRRWTEAVDEQDLEAIRACMADDILVEIPFSESGRVEDGQFRTYAGIEEVTGFWATAFQAEGESAGPCNVEITVSADGSTIFSEMYGKLTMANGRDYRNRYVMRMVIEDGLVKHVREYYNPIQSAYAFGRKIAGHIPVDTLDA
jgi:ketosteroid isomerase-like protein